MKFRLLTEKTSIFLIWAGMLILGIMLILFLFRASIFDLDQEIDQSKFDSFGSIVGGLIGSIWSLASIILFYIALNEQRKATNHQREAIDDQKKALEINIRAFEAQVESLKIQTNEFELQREELAQTRQVFIEQSKTLKLQQFESTFFSMLNLHHQIVNTMDATKIVRQHPMFASLTGKSEPTIVNYTARDCFKYFYEQFQQQYSIDSIGQPEEFDKSAEIELITKCYSAFYIENQSDLGHYFRNLYQILKFINTKNPDDKFFYSNLLRAQLSAFELLLLFYNCLSTFGREKFKPLIEHYHFLQNMPKAPLLNKEKHVLLYDKRAFGHPE